MVFKINGAEVLNRRQKRTAPCSENWERYDEELKRMHIQKVGCKPPYMNSTLGTKLCTSKDQMKQAYYRLLGGDRKEFLPCRAMETISYTYEEASINVADVKWAKRGIFFLSIEISERFKLISYNR